MKAWSFSGLTKYENCPRMYHITKVLGLVKEPPTEATAWGSSVHLALELRVRDGTPLPPTMAKFEPTAARLAGMKGEVFVEREMGITKDLKPTGFHDADCWYRCIIDVGCAYTSAVFLGDYKTGKVKTDHDQLELSSATFLSSYPEIDVARSAYIWLVNGTMTRKDIKREIVPAIWSKYRGRIARLENAYDNDKWIPRPSGLCQGWCAVGREYCEFWSPRRKK